MIRRVKIDNFKCLVSEQLDIKPLTIVTGLNSTGKSSLLQAILLPTKLHTKNGRLLLDSISGSFESVRNIYENAKEVKIEVAIGGETTSYSVTIGQGRSEFDGSAENSVLDLENNVYYLSANRVGAELHSKISAEFKIGVTGEYVLGTYENEKSKAVITDLVKEQISYTLSTQVNYWLSYILGINIELQTERRADNNVEIRYKSDGISNMTPFQLGSGVSYLAKIVIMCLRAKKNDVLIIENPEIHLHPATQSRIGEFLAFIVNAGVQVIVETHCEHLIFKIQHEVYKKKLKHDDVAILYKEGIRTPFLAIDLDKNGKFSKDFPEGFFDATLEGILEME